MVAAVDLASGVSPAGNAGGRKVAVIWAACQTDQLIVGGAASCGPGLTNRTTTAALTTAATAAVAAATIDQTASR